MEEIVEDCLSMEADREDLCSFAPASRSFHQQPSISSKPTVRRIWTLFCFNRHYIIFIVRKTTIN